VPLSQGNIGHRDITFYNANSNLNRFEAGTENPRVGGSIPPLATIQINIANQEVASKRMDSLSIISAGVQYCGPLLV
jgi:hypothetical protein